MPFNNIHPYLRNLSFGKGREKKSNTKFFEKNKCCVISVKKLW